MYVSTCMHGTLQVENKAILVLCLESKDHIPHQVCEVIIRLTTDLISSTISDVVSIIIESVCYRSLRQLIKSCYLPVICRKCMVSAVTAVVVKTVFCQNLPASVKILNTD